MKMPLVCVSYVDFGGHANATLADEEDNTVQVRLRMNPAVIGRLLVGTRYQFSLESQEGGTPV